MTIYEESLQLHYEKKGKIEIVSTVPVKDAKDLSLAYTPGVAQPCLEIQKDPELDYELGISDRKQVCRSWKASACFLRNLAKWTHFRSASIQKMWMNLSVPSN